jgi:hypothetical protein
MRFEDERLRLPGNAGRVGNRLTDALAKTLAVAVGATLLVVAFMFSLIVFALLAAAGLLVLGYLWWRTRDLRRHLRERPPGGHVIEGEMIREDSSRRGAHAD